MTTTASTTTQQVEQQAGNGRANNTEDDNNDNVDNNNRRLHVVVVVLGDLGRSPRMQYHALSLLQAGHCVSLVGYDGEELIPDLLASEYRNNNRLFVIRFSVPAPVIFQKIRLVYFVWRIASLSIWLFYALLMRVPKKTATAVPAVDCVLVQNPPALPLLLVAYIYCRIQGLICCKKRPGLLIDWHNLGYSMLNGGAIGKVAKIYEKAVAPLADAHLTVTHAMKDLLEEEILVNAALTTTIQVVADCPPYMFQPRTLKEQHDILSKLHEPLLAACPRQWTPAITGNAALSQTILTECYDGNKYRPRRGRPALVTSSTSWTSDEDFGILLAALLLLDQQIQRCESSPLKVVVVVTGKGPQKTMYEEKISRMKLSHVAVSTLWLEPSDYPLLMACADLGVSLHTSTSGVDLPMKVLDMFGCQVPVCAKDFECLSELVQDDVNGRIFNSSEQLADLLWELLQPMTKCSEGSGNSPTAGGGSGGGCGGPASHDFGSLARYSAALEGRERWSENWMRYAQPVILETAKKHV